MHRDKFKSQVRYFLLTMSLIFVLPSLALAEHPVSEKGNDRGRLDKLQLKTQLLIDQNMALYKKVDPQLSGELNSTGSDTLNNLMALWAEGFNDVYPEVRIQIEGKGSSTAPPALIESTAQMGPMSRKMKQSEMDSFERKFSYKPTAIRIAVDALAVFVHRDNPIEGLSLAQVDAIFSKMRKRGLQKDITTWGALGLSAIWENQTISLYGRNSASGTNGYFKKVVLKSGDYKNSVKEQPGSSAVVQGLSVDRYGIGYSGIGYTTSGVRALGISSSRSAGQFVIPNSENAFNGSYPLARFLYVYINKEPGKPLDKLTREFLYFILSRDGQEEVLKDGYYPLNTKIVLEELEKIS